MTIAPVGITAFYVWNDLGVYYYFGPGKLVFTHFIFCTIHIITKFATHLLPLVSII